MNSELTDIYRIINYYYKDVIKKYDLENSRELFAFLHYNAHNEMFLNTNDSDNEYPEINVKSLDSVKMSKFYVKNGINFIPTDKDVVKNNYNTVAFNISNGTKLIIINDIGLFVERSNLKNKIICEYYDNAALNEINRERIEMSEVQNIDNRIKMMGIMPDNIIKADLNDEEVDIEIIENGEPILQDRIKKGSNRTFYSIYYEFMKSQKYYGKELFKNNSIGFHK